MAPSNHSRAALSGEWVRQVSWESMEQHESSVVELRNYTLHPGRRDALITLFERAFIETQEACGIGVIGHFRNLDDPDRFVWFRGFRDMRSRRAALERFYLHDPAWLQNRDAANETMVDSDDVLLLRPARARSGFALQGLERPQAGHARADSTVIGVAMLMLESPLDELQLDTFERELLPQLADAGRLAYFVTETQRNDFTRLPVRDDHALVVVGVSEDLDALDAWHRLFGANWQKLRLEPAARSLLR